MNPTGRRGRRYRRITRDTVLFLAGIILTFHESFMVVEPRATLIALFAGMMGLPVFTNLDDKRNRRGDGQPD